MFNSIITLDSFNKEINNELNTLIKENSPFTRKDFKSLALNTFIKISSTSIYYYKDLKILINLKYSTYITPTIDAISKHLKKKYTTDYLSNNKDRKARYKELLNTIENEITPLGFTTIDSLGSINSNTYYYLNLSINLNGYKCRDCYYINISSKQIRKYFNKIYYTIKDIKSNTKATYIIENTPIIIISSYSKNSRLSFIPKLPTPFNKEKALEDSTSSNKELISSLSNNSRISNLISTYNKEYREEASLNININKNNLNIDKEGTFFNRTSKYYKYLEDKDINLLLTLVDTNLTKDSFLEFLYNNIIKLGLESFNSIETKPLSIRISINETFSSNTKRETKPFKVLYLAT